jgi:hypothetical protein
MSRLLLKETVEHQVGIIYFNSDALSLLNCLTEYWSTKIRQRMEDYLKYQQATRHTDDRLFLYNIC